MDGQSALGGPNGGLLSRLISLLNQLFLWLRGRVDIEILLLVPQLFFERFKLRSCGNATRHLIGQLALPGLKVLLKFQVFFLAVSEHFAHMENTAFTRLVLLRLGLKSCYDMLLLPTFRNEGGRFS